MSNWSRYSRLVPAMMFVLVAIGLVAMWWRLDLAESEMLNLRTETTVEQVALRLESYIAARMHLVRQVLRQWKAGQCDTPAQFTELAEAIQREFSSFQAINWVDAEGVIRWVVPPEPNLPAQDRDLHDHEGLGRVLDKAAATGRPVASFPLELFQGGRGFATYFPIVIDGRLNGYINGVFRMNRLVSDCLDDRVRSEFYMRIADQGGFLHENGPPKVLAESPFVRTYPLRVLDREWDIRIAPTPRLAARYRTPVDEVLLAIGLLLAAGLALTLKAFMERQRALQASEQRLRFTQFATDNAAVATFWIRKDAGFIYVNQAACDALGYTREELLGLGVYDVDAVFPREGWEEQWKSLNRLNRPYTFETVHRRKDGSTFPVEVTTNSLEYRGEFYQFSFAKDISERKRAEEERLNMERALLETQRLESLGLLAGGVAHDFNNLLTAMMGSVSLARRELGENSPISGHLRHLDMAAQQAADLAHQLLAYSGRGRFVLARLDLRSIVRETDQLLAVSVPKHVELVKDLGDEAAWVQADAAQLRQIVMNLVINAAEAIGDAPGGLTVRTRPIDADADYLSRTLEGSRLEPGSYSMLEVVDTGPGMDAETRARVFEPFYSTKATGRGLGLAAVVGIVRGHGGAVLLDTQPGRGTTFTVLLPACEAPAETDTDRPTTRRDGDKTAGGTILVIDDEQSVRTVAASILEAGGYAVLTAEDGPTGLQTFDARTPDIRAVLLDLSMPGMDGRQVLRELRRRVPGLRVLLSSGYEDQSAATDLDGETRTDFIHKPYRADQLIDAIEHLLAGQ